MFLKLTLTLVVGVFLFSLYTWVLMHNGENSLNVLEKLESTKSSLINEKSRLKNDNQKLQKEYFELNQLKSNF